MKTESQIKKRKMGKKIEKKMRDIFILLSICFAFFGFAGTASAAMSDHFVTTWKTDNVVQQIN